jgi:hypothetical protein
MIYVYAMQSMRPNRLKHGLTRPSAKENRPESDLSHRPSERNDGVLVPENNPGDPAMLSYILGMAFRFEREHGCSPNLLYLNQEHMQRLSVEMGVSAVRQLSEKLGLAVMVYPNIVHPQVVCLHRFHLAASGH